MVRVGHSVPASGRDSYLFGEVRVDFFNMGVQGPSEYIVQVTRHIQAVWVEQHAVQFHVLLCVVAQNLHEALQERRLHSWIALFHATPCFCEFCLVLRISTTRFPKS